MGSKKLWTFLESELSRIRILQNEIQSGPDLFLFQFEYKSFTLIEFKYLFISKNVVKTNNKKQLFWLISALRHFQTANDSVRRSLNIYALSFYGTKMILDRPNNFGRVPIVLDGSNSFWSGPNHFGQVVIIKFAQRSLIWTWPKWLGPDQNNFGPIKG